jgi:hypothetical protein
VQGASARHARVRAWPGALLVASRCVRGCERVWGTGFADRGWGLVQERHRVVLFTLATHITSHAGTLVRKIGRCANDLADLLASRLRIAQLSTA